LLHSLAERTTKLIYLSADYRVNGFASFPHPFLTGGPPSPLPNWTTIIGVLPASRFKLCSSLLHIVYNLIKIRNPLLERYFEVFPSSADHYLLHSPTGITATNLGGKISKVI
jgi:hypothetical protein